MKYLFKYWDKISAEILKCRRLFLFFDYDGTLTPIVSRPELAKFPKRVKNLIRQLASSPNITIAIISGRAVKDIKKHIGLKNIIYAGNHGMEIEGRGIKFPRPKGIISTRPLIKEIYLSLRKALSQHKGVIVENKGDTLSVHYRLVLPGKKALIKKMFCRVVAPYLNTKDVRVSVGKEVFEVRPNVRWDKGKAVNWLLRKDKKSFVLYAGDDVTDIDAFRAIEKRGVSIFVGKQRRGICADYFVRNAKELEKFILMITQIVLY